MPSPNKVDDTRQVVSQPQLLATMQTQQNQLRKIVTPSAAAISTAAAVAAISGSFQHVQPQATPSAPVTTSSNLKSNSANSTADSISALSGHSSSKPKVMPTSDNQSNHGSQVLGYQTMNVKANATAALPMHHMNMQPPSTVPTYTHTLTQTPNQVQPQPYSSFALPQHLDYNLQSFQPYSYRRPPQQDATPQIFRNTTLRRGKWTNEEETYANAVIDAFEKGTIQGCENGCTLRAYLSRKLHCQPMRISKKFAGKSIGKQVFMSRLNSSALRIGGGAPAAVQSSNETLKQLEFHFHLSVLQEGLSTDPTRAMTAINHVNIPNTSPCFGSQNLLKPPNHHLNPMKTHLGNVSITNSRPVNMVLTKQPCKKAPSSLPPVNVNCVNIKKTGDGAIQVRNMVRAQKPVQIPHSQLQENLFNAFKQAQTLHTVNARKTIDEQPKGNLINSGVSCKIGNVGDSSSVKKAEPIVSQCVPSEELNSVNAKQNWINETMAIIPTLDPTNYGGRYSPTYTSKSFDDLHQFIGHHVPRSPQKNCGYTSTNDQMKGKIGQALFGPATAAANKLTLDEQLAPQSQRHDIINTVQKVAKGGGNQQVTFMNASDEYAFHAQQSAIEASKHSAYNSTSFIQPKRQVAALKCSDTPIISATGVKKQTYSSTNSSVASFNNTNLELHSIAASNLGIQGVPQMSLGPNATARYTKINSQNTFNKQGTIVSCSERSSDMGDMGTDSSVSVVGTSSSRTSSGSDNDNNSSSSDSASDEGRGLTGSSHKGKRKFEKSQQNRNPLHGEKVAKLDGQGLQ